LSWGIEREVTELFFRRDRGKQTDRDLKVITISYYDVKREMARKDRLGQKGGFFGFLGSC
jgi:hypothetical protein